MSVNPQWQEFGFWLRKVRESRGLTQEKLARTVSLSPQHYNKIETGMSGTRKATIQRLAVALGVEVAKAYEKAGLQEQVLANHFGPVLANHLKHGYQDNLQEPLPDFGGVVAFQSEASRLTIDVDHIVQQLAETLTIRFKDQASHFVEQFASQMDLLTAEAVRSHLEKYLSDIRNIASADALTGLNNRVAFYQILQREFILSQRYKVPLSLLLLDIDNFKSYNDNHGSPQGDCLLQELAHTLKQQARRTDTVARLGGGEFAIILPHTYGEAADILARRYRTNIKKGTWNESGVTVSVGVAVATSTMSSQNELVSEAAEALSKAKNDGRHKVVMYSGEAFEDQPVERASLHR